MCSQLEVAMVNQYESIIGGLGGVKWHDNVHFLSNYVEKWRVLRWTKDVSTDVLSTKSSRLLSSMRVALL